MNVAHIQAGFAYLVLAFATLLLKCLPQQAQISIPVKIAILISFSVAIITILVSADNENIRQLKDRASSEKLYKEVNGKRLSLFQIMLSNIAYNTTIEVFYLVILIALSLSKTIVPIVALKIILSFCVVVIVHIFTVLLESVSQMYLTFWEKKE